MRWEKFKEDVIRTRKAQDELNRKSEIMHYISIDFWYKKKVFELNPFCINLKNGDYLVNKARNVMTGRLCKVPNLRGFFK